MGITTTPQPFSPRYGVRHLSNFKRAVVAIKEGASYNLARVNGQAGHLDFVQVSLESNNALALKIQLDDKILFNHSYTQIVDDGAGKLSMPLLYGLAAPFGGTRSTTSYYGIMFNGAMFGATFERELEVDVVNIGNAEWDIQGFYILWAIKHPKPKEES